MEILVSRKIYTINSTIGEMWIENDKFYCYTLEPSQLYNKDQTLISEGRYPITYYDSPKFKRSMPLIGCSIPFVEIHYGNFADDRIAGHKIDTTACTILGSSVNVDMVCDSVIQFNDFWTTILNNGTLENVWITYKNN